MLLLLFKIEAGPWDRDEFTNARVGIPALL